MIDREEALAIARRRADANGWGIVEPLVVTERRGWNGTIRHFDVVSDPARRGTKVRFRIEAASGDVSDEAYLPR